MQKAQSERTLRSQMMPEDNLLEQTENIWLESAKIRKKYQFKKKLLRRKKALFESQQTIEEKEKALQDKEDFIRKRQEEIEKMKNKL